MLNVVSLFLALLLPLSGLAATKGEDKNQLDAAFASIDAAETQFHEQGQNIRPELQKSLETLDRLIQSNRLDDEAGIQLCFEPDFCPQILSIGPIAGWTLGSRRG